MGAPAVTSATNGLEMASEWQRRAAPHGSPVHLMAAAAARVDGWRASSEERSGGRRARLWAHTPGEKEVKEWQKPNVLVALHAGHGIFRRSRRFGRAAARTRPQALALSTLPPWQ